MPDIACSIITHNLCMMRTLRHLSLITLLMASVAHAQIPNGGFEDWTDFGNYEDPVGWTSLNVLTTTFGGVLSCEQAVPAAEGSYGVTVTSRDIPGFGLFPGLLLTGDAEASADGFPYTARPQALNGMWEAAIASGDDGAVVVTLSRWNASLGEREEIGAGIVTVTGTVNAWTSFSAAIQYVSTEDPDTASIAILSSAGLSGEAAAGSALSVDDLSFGSATTVPELAEGVLSTFPVPVVDELTVTAPSAMQELSLWSMDGRLVLSARPSDLRTTVNVGELPSGSYAVLVRLSHGRTLRQVITRQ